MSLLLQQNQCIYAVRLGRALKFLDSDVCSTIEPGPSVYTLSMVSSHMVHLYILYLWFQATFYFVIKLFSNNY